MRGRQRGRMSKLLRVQSHQPAGDQRRRQCRCGRVIPGAANWNDVLHAAVNLVAERDAGDHAQSRSAKLFADGKRHRDIVARMSHLSGTDVGIVQVQRANQNSIQQHGLR